MEPRNYVQEAEEIVKSHNMFSNDFAKKVLIWFWRKSENFTKSIAVSVYTQDPEKFELFDESDVARRAKAFIFQDRLGDAGIAFDSEDGIVFRQGSMMGLVKEPFASKEYIREHPEKQDSQIVNEKAYTLYFVYGKYWAIGSASLYLCEVIDFNLEEVEAIAL